ncbi:hypothetical protein GS531_16995 [Rhodococcus hoagii]|nr:hypothetical protein [Prescottella equi]
MARVHGAAGDPDAAGIGYAGPGAPALDGFQDGLRVTHDGERSHNVVLGHSYGTTLVGTAASQGRTLDADALVFVASPGTSVNHVTDLSLTGISGDEIGDHVFSTKSARDPVPLFADTHRIAVRTLGSPGAAWAAFDKFVEGHDGGPFGVDPTRADFGGRAFTSDAGRPGRCSDTTPTPTATIGTTTRTVRRRGRSETWHSSSRDDRKTSRDPRSQAPHRDRRHRRNRRDTGVGVRARNERRHSGQFTHRGRGVRAGPGEPGRGALDTSPDTALSRTPQNPELATLTPGMTAPCTWDDTQGDPPVSARVGYWVVGVPDGRTREYLQMIVDGLTAGGGTSAPINGPPTVRRARRPGPLRDAVQIAPGRPGSLSVEGTSPCFVGRPGRNDPTEPPVIEHP